MPLHHPLYRETGNFFARHIGFGSSFGGVIGNLTSSVKKVIHKGLSVIQGIVHSLFQFTSAGWIECIQPGPEFVPDRRFFFLAFLFPLLSREILIKTFQIEQPVAVRNSLLSRKQRRISSCAILWLLDLLFRVNIQKFQLFSPLFWNGFIKLSPAMSQTTYQNNVFDSPICGITIAVEHPGKTRQKLDGITSVSCI